MFIEALELLGEDQQCTLSWNVSSEPSVVFWNDNNFFDGCIKLSGNPVPVSFLQINTSSGCGGLWHNNRVYSNTDRTMLCARDGIQNRFLTHILNVYDTKMRSGLYSFFHTALLNHFGSFGLCITDRLFESANFSTDSSTLFVVVYPQSILWLLKSPIVM